MSTLLIAGAHGTTGKQLVKRLVSAGHTVKAGVRAPEQIASMRDLGADGVLLDLTKPQLFPSALETVDQVVFVAGSGGKAVEAVDRDGAISLVDASAQAGIGKFVMLSSIGVDAPQQGPEGLQDYLKAKQVADNHLKDSGLDYVIVRPVSLTNDTPTGHIKSQDIEPGKASIPRADVAHAIQAAIEIPGTKSSIVEIASGGIEVGECMLDKLVA